MPLLIRSFIGRKMSEINNSHEKLTKLQTINKNLESIRKDIRSLFNDSYFEEIIEKWDDQLNLNEEPSKAGLWIYRYEDYIDQIKKQFELMMWMLYRMGKLPGIQEEFVYEKIKSNPKQSKPVSGVVDRANSHPEYAKLLTMSNFRVVDDVLSSTIINEWLKGEIDGFEHDIGHSNTTIKFEISYSKNPEMFTAIQKNLLALLKEAWTTNLLQLYSSQDVDWFLNNDKKIKRLLEVVALDWGDYWYGKSNQFESIEKRFNEFCDDMKKLRKMNVGKMKEWKPYLVYNLVELLCDSKNTRLNIKAIQACDIFSELSIHLSKSKSVINFNKIWTHHRKGQHDKFREILSKIISEKLLMLDAHSIYNNNYIPHKIRIANHQ